MTCNGQSSALLRLPGELRNEIYEYIAHSSKRVAILSPDKIVTLGTPFGFVCRQVNDEFGPIYDGLSVSFAMEVEVQCENFDLRSLNHALHETPAPRDGIFRTVTFEISLTNALKSATLHTFIKMLSEPAVLLKTAANVNYHVSFDAEMFDLDTWRCHVARIGKTYLYHHTEAEQKIWEKIYWSFVEVAEKVDGVSEMDFAMGLWQRKAGAISI